MARPISTILFLLLAATAGAQADHLQCYKIKDIAPKATYTATLTPTDTGFPVATGCLVRTPAKLLCIDVVKTIQPPPTPPGAGPGNPAQKYLCYKVKCPKAAPTATIQDQFGTHQVTAKGTSLLCAPEPAPTTTTSTTTTSTTTTTQCVDADGDGFFAPPCGNDCNDMNPQINPMHPEVCNGIDDNCNGMIDEGLGNISCGVGACHNTVSACVNGQPNMCTPGTPSPETCNGIDDDCNGAVDDGLPPTTCGTGACQNTVPSCVNGQPNTCTPLPPGPEICGNGIDDDCDGMVDEQPCNCTTSSQCPGAQNATAACQGGMCTIQCNAGFLNCNGNNADGCEVNIQVDSNNCGGCGHVCAAPNASSMFCAAGTCHISSCNMGFGDCNANPADGCETNVTNNNANCGMCGNVCTGATPTCVGTTCQ